MNSGLEILNDDGRILIDNSFYNIALIQKIPLSNLTSHKETIMYVSKTHSDATSRYERVASNIIDIGYFDYPCMGITANMSVLQKINIYRSEKHGWAISWKDGELVDLSNMYVYFYNFSLNAPVSESGINCGLVVYNENGEVIYSSGRQYAQFYGIGVPVSQIDASKHIALVSAAVNSDELYTKHNNWYFPWCLIRWDSNSGTTSIINYFIGPPDNAEISSIQPLPLLYK